MGLNLEECDLVGELRLAIRAQKILSFGKSHKENTGCRVLGVWKAKREEQRAKRSDES